MNKRIEEISTNLDKIVGGQELFNINSSMVDEELCSTFCTTDCQNSVGTTNGTTKGIVF